MKAFKCDICGSYADGHYEVRQSFFLGVLKKKVKVVYDIYDRNGRPIDACPACMHKIVNGGDSQV